jgi:hypothetical protein
MRITVSILALAALFLAPAAGFADDPAATPAPPPTTLTDTAPAPASPEPAAPPAAAEPAPAATEPAPAAPAPVSLVGACTLKDGQYPTATVFTTPNSCDESGYCTIQTCWHGAWYKRTLGCNQRAQTCPAFAPS